MLLVVYLIMIDLGDIIKNPLEGITNAAKGLFDGNNLIDTMANAISTPMRSVMDTVGGIFGKEDLGDIIKNPLEGLQETVGDTLLKTITAPIVPRKFNTFRRGIIRNIII
jgi:hypothetical protein